MKNSNCVEFKEDHYIFAHVRKKGSGVFDNIFDITYIYDQREKMQALFSNIVIKKDFELVCMKEPSSLEYTYHNKNIYKLEGLRGIN